MENGTGINHLIRIKLNSSVPGVSLPYEEMGVVSGLNGFISNLSFDFKGVLWGRQGDSLIKFPNPSQNASYSLINVGAILPTAGSLGMIAYENTAQGHSRIIVASTPNGDIRLVQPEPTPSFTQVVGSPGGGSRGLARFPGSTTVYEGGINYLFRFDMNVPGSNIPIGPLNGSMTVTNMRSLSATPHGYMWGFDFTTLRIVKIATSGQVLEHHNLTPTNGALAIQYMEIVAYANPCNPAAWAWSDCDNNAVADSCQIISNPGLDCDGNGVLDSCDPDCDANGVPDACEVDCNNNGIPDTCDIMSGTSLDCDGNGVPDECDPDCSGNGIPDVCEQDCNNNGSPDDCDILSGTSVDCDSNGIPDECQPDCDFDGVPDACETDCNGNNIPDDCDLASGTSADCNNNGIPDECDPDCSGNGIPNDCEADCNSNLIADDCDIDSGTSEDCNRNGVPDECEPQGADCDVNGLVDACEIQSNPALDCNANLILDSCEASLLEITGMAAGQPASVSTWGGTAVFAGQYFDVAGPGTTVVHLLVRGEEFELPAQDIMVNMGGTELSVTLPPISPGCDCGSEVSIPVDIRIDNGCAQQLVSDAGIDFVYAIEKSLVATSDNLQQAIDTANPGTCVVLHQYALYSGPITLDAGDSFITLTNIPGGAGQVTQIAGSGHLTTPVMTFDACGPEICISNLHFLLGNTGAEILNGSQPLIMRCQFDDNIADASRGGGITIRGNVSVDPCATHPTIIGCSIVFNETAGSGGGIRIEHASATIVDNLIQDNATSGFGGGIYIEDNCSDLLIAHNSIQFHNESNGSVPLSGGGVYWTEGAAPTQGPPVSALAGELLHNAIRSNTALSNGGGVHIGLHVAPSIAGNIIAFNELTEADENGDGANGGGIYVEAFNSREFGICENIIYENRAQRGAGIALMNKNKVRAERNFVFCNRSVQLYESPGGPNPPPPPRFYAAGIYAIDADVELHQNTIWSNQGVGGSPAFTAGDNQSGGIHGDSLSTGAPVFVDNLIGNNEGWELYSRNDILFGLVDYNLVYDAADSSRMIHIGFNGPPGSGSNTHNLDPQLANPNCMPSNPQTAIWSDFAPTTALVEGLSSTGLTPGAVYQAGYVGGDCFSSDPRDCDRNGIDDAIDLIAFPERDCDGNGILDDCETSPGIPYCFGDGSGAACPCTNLAGTGEGCANQTTSGALLSTAGTASVAADNLALVVSQMQTTQFGIIYRGTNDIEAPFGDGLRCVGQNVIRFPIRGSGGSGSFAEPGSGVSSVASYVGATAGATDYFQGWYRDPGGPCGAAFNLTNGISLAWCP